MSKTKQIFSNKKVTFFGALLVIGLFSGIGAYLIDRSSAATTTPTFTRYGTVDSLQTYYTKGVEIVKDTLGGYETDVAQLDSSNDVLMFDEARPTPFTIEKQTCYSMRSLDASNPAKVKISDGVSNSRSVIVVSDINDGFASEYRDYCVSSTSSVLALDYDVKHISGGKVNVFIKRQSLQHCPDLETPCN